MMVIRWTSLGLAMTAGAGALCALGGSTVSPWCTGEARTVSDIYQEVGQFASISGVLLGFLIAALSILTTIGDRQLIVNIRKTGHFTVLLREMFFASNAFLLTLSLSLLCLFVPLPYAAHLTAAVVAIFVFSTGMLVSAGRKFYIVLSNL